MTVTNTPERIRVAQDADGFWTCREAISGSQEYVRVDILEAALSRSAEAGKPVVKVKALEWTVFCSRTGNSVAKTPFGEYVIQIEPDGWCLYLLNNDDAHASYSMSDFAKAAAQADYEARIRSALSTPADIEPVAWLVRDGLYRDQAFVNQQIAQNRAEERGMNSEIVPLYAAPVAVREPVSVPEGWRPIDTFPRKKMRALLSDGVTIRIGGRSVICTGGLTKNGFWFSQDAGFNPELEFTPIKWMPLPSLSAAPQPNPSEVEASAVIERLTKALEPFASLQVPKNAQYNAGAYSIRHSDIEAARAALSSTKSGEVER
jgi:hypothetical protein